MADQNDSEQPKKSTQQQRADDRRAQKLAEIKQQVEEGTLNIRQMTPEEREANPPRPREPRKPRRR